MKIPIIIEPYIEMDLDVRKIIFYAIKNRIKTLKDEWIKW
jgi:hypothetical protein